MYVIDVNSCTGIHTPEALRAVRIFYVDLPYLKCILAGVIYLKSIDHRNQLYMSAPTIPPPYMSCTTNWRRHCFVVEHAAAGEREEFEPHNVKTSDLRIGALTLPQVTLIFHCLADLRHLVLVLDDRIAVASTTGPNRSSKANANLR